MRVSFLVDGFNLYHSIQDAVAESGVGAKWLDIRAFCASYLPQLGRDATLESVHYFSALATHLVPTNPGVVHRHEAFITALKHTGVEVELGRFKRKEVWCPTCRRKILKHEEKETDVAIAVRLVELALTNKCDIAVLLTGDTDVAPGIRTLRRLLPAMKVCVVLPYKRINAELQQVASVCFRVKADRYSKFQLPASITLADHRIITKPPSW